jgi:two-component system chemotaxis response regulator CheB
MEALKAGALSVVEKPAAATHRDYAAMASRLCMQLAIMSEVKVVRQRPKPHAGLAKEWPAAASNLYSVLGVATSTGGPSALMELLTGLGADFSLPVVVVQHMTAGFMEGFASWLAGVTPMPLEVVEKRTLLAPGRVYLAPCHSHLIIEGSYAALDDSPPIGSHRPAADMMFSSMARTAGASGIGVVLTGMGEDGAAGLRELRAAGGYTIAEDETSAVVYGMPAAAVRMGGASESLPLGGIAPRILALIGARAEVD